MLCRRREHLHFLPDGSQTSAYERLKGDFRLQLDDKATGFTVNVGWFTKLGDAANETKLGVNNPVRPLVPPIYFLLKDTAFPPGVP